MNCKDIALMLDDGDIRTLNAEMQRAVENHLADCTACARIWNPLAHLAQSPAPVLPQRFAEQCATLVVAGNPLSRQHATRIKFVVIGSLAVLAAAAGVLLHQAGKSAADPGQSAAAVTDQISALIAREVPAAVKLTRDEEFIPQPGVLPLLPAPLVGQSPDEQKLVFVLQRLVERHPELVEGPEVDGIFAAVLAMRADGTVINSAVQLATSGTVSEISQKLGRTLPRLEGGESVPLYLQKQHPLSGGRNLRGRVFVNAKIVPDDYDPTHSEVLVREILGHKYDALLLPSTGNEENLLTVFLSADGHIERESVQLFNRATFGDALKPRADLRPVIASQLGLNIDQIGLTGSTTVVQGFNKLVTDPSGMRRAQGDQRSLAVLYAWSRAEGKPYPVRGQAPEPMEEWDFDLAIAREIVEQLIPDAFTYAGSAAGTPSVVLTAKGEVIRAGRVHMRNGVSVEDLLREQLVPGVSVGNMTRIVRLTNKSGASATVTLAWTD